MLWSNIHDTDIIANASNIPSTHIASFLYIHACIYIYIDMNILCVYTHTYIYIYTYTYTYMCIYILFTHNKQINQCIYMYVYISK